MAAVGHPPPVPRDPPLRWHQRLARRRTEGQAGIGDGLAGGAYGVAEVTPAHPTASRDSQYEIGDLLGETRQVLRQRRTRRSSPGTIQTPVTVPTRGVY